jgi:hypothetical protein
LFARPSFPGEGWFLLGDECIVRAEAVLVRNAGLVWLAIVGFIDVQNSSSLGFVAVANRHV